MDIIVRIKEQHALLQKMTLTRTALISLSPRWDLLKLLNDLQNNLKEIRL